jgi:alpha-glucosidase
LGDNKVLDAQIGKHVTIARKDRSTSDWYVGSITNEEARTIDINLNFLSPEKKYIAEIYQDGKDADVTTNPLPIEIKKEEVSANSVLKIRLATGGGGAIRLYETK